MFRDVGIVPAQSSINDLHRLAKVTQSGLCKFTTYVSAAFVNLEMDKSTYTPR